MISPEEANMTTDRRTFIKSLSIAAVATPPLFASGAVPAIAADNAAVPGKNSLSIFDPVQIGTLTLKNRLMRSATSQLRSDSNGNPTPDLMRVYNELASGGASMIVTGLTYVMKEDQYAEHGSGFYDDSQLEKFRAAVDGVHSHGAKFCMQLAAIGTKSDYKVNERTIYSPVVLKDPSYGTVAKKEMSKADIAHCVESFAQAAARAHKCGFDAVELHFAHNYLVSKFLVPYFNQRTDEYGGSVENRARFAFEIVVAVRQAVGKDFPVIAKIEGNDYLGREGNSADDIAYIANGLVERGIDALEISGGNSVTKYGPIIPDILYEEDQTYFSRDARNLAKKVNVALILTGGNRNVSVMETALKHNKNLAAFGMSRTLLAEPDLPNKWRENPSSTPKCISCNWCIQNYGKQKTQCRFRRDQTV
jgi:2,4-dienoyl-CoA reductase-like NADH-dependent reductase (Old Yellow Enzyme family)